ncbi:Phage baseplate (plasmid) [Carbonactinospora thermoautotrophica]|uniref:Phage baseplate n=1 Tax=Carbonactinospora thermoautotrophica TaxID=1469144 RepID=A0A132MIY9_9ACTN|nr:baseplate J/gp47 family protein [Carbonactinospora thermoautotrophica]KWW97391.1 Phage baseplate [Carbonactinospora thermoautotrophica]
MSVSTPEPLGSPDTPGYVDLALYDADEQELVSRALADATLKLPGWVPREGNTEVVLIESLALIVGELVYAINRVPATVLEGVLALYGLQRDPGKPTTGRVRFTLSDMLGHMIPAGTRLRATVAATGETVDLETVEPLEVLFGATSGEVDVTGVEVGDAGNGIAAGTVLELVDAVPYVDRVELVTALAGGADPEPDDAYYGRGSALLSRLVSTLVLPSHFTAAALAHTSVKRAMTIDLYDPGQAGNPGDHQGHVTVAVADANGNPLSSSVKNEVEASLTAKALAGLRVHVVDPTITTVDVTVTITVTGTDTAGVQTAVADAIRGYLSPSTWAWGGTVHRNELISLIDRVEGVGRVVDITTPAGDVALAGVAPLAQAGTVTVNVQAGA